MPPFGMANGQWLTEESIIYCEQDCVSRDLCNCPFRTTRINCKGTFVQDSESRVLVGPSSSLDPELFDWGNRRVRACFRSGCNCPLSRWFTTRLHCDGFFFQESHHRDPRRRPHARGVAKANSEQRSGMLVICGSRSTQRCGRTRRRPCCTTTGGIRPWRNEENKLPSRSRRSFEAGERLSNTPRFTLDARLLDLCASQCRRGAEKALCPSRP
jgi:hypothetical protein